MQLPLTCDPLHVQKDMLQSSNCHRCHILCPECHHVFQHIPKYARGDPRNIALIGHWDGWQPFGSTGQHSCGESTRHMYNVHALHGLQMKLFVLSGSIEVTIATMSKAERSHTDEVYVVGFVPCHLLPNKRPCSFDPFLHPLITDIEDSFISGMWCNNLINMNALLIWAPSRNYEAYRQDYISLSLSICPCLCPCPCPCPSVPAPVPLANYAHVSSLPFHGWFTGSSRSTLKSRRPYTYLGGQHACTSDIGILVHSLIFGWLYLAYTVTNP